MILPAQLCIALSNPGCICFRASTENFNYVIAVHPNGRKMEIAESFSLGIFLKHASHELYNFDKNYDSFDEEGGSTKNWQYCRAVFVQIGRVSRCIKHEFLQWLLKATSTFLL